MLVHITITDKYPLSGGGGGIEWTINTIEMLVLFSTDLIIHRPVCVAGPASRAEQAAASVN